MKKMNWLDVAFIFLFFLNGGLCVYFSLRGIAEADAPKVIWGMIYGILALFWLCVEGANHEP